MWHIIKFIWNDYGYVQEKHQARSSSMSPRLNKFINISITETLLHSLTFSFNCWVRHLHGLYSPIAFGFVETMQAYCHQLFIKDYLHLRNI